MVFGVYIGLIGFIVVWRALCYFPCIGGPNIDSKILEPLFWYLRSGTPTFGKSPIKMVWSSGLVGVMSWIWRRFPLYS